MGILDWLKGEKVLYYPGCLTKGVLKNEFENYKKIFNKLKIDFVLLTDKEACCGLPALNAGHKKDVKKLIKKNLKLFKENGIDKIITNCPSCLHAFKNVYPKLVREWDIPAEHATVVILRALKRKKWKENKPTKDKEIVAYHDPCHLGRYCKIYNEPRKVIEILGGKIIESRFNRENALCCGGGGGVRANFEKLAKNIANERKKSFDESIEKIISPCGLCYTNLKSATNKSIEFSSFVLSKLQKEKNEK